MPVEFKLAVHTAMLFILILQHFYLVFYRCPNVIDRKKSSYIANCFFWISGRSPLAQMEEERREHVAKMKKMEMEMEQVFEMKVKEKVQKLKDSEAEVIEMS